MDYNIGNILTIFYIYFLIYFITNKYIIIFFITFPILLSTLIYSLIMYYEYYCMEDYTDYNQDCNVIKSIVLYCTI